MSLTEVNGLRQSLADWSPAPSPHGWAVRDVITYALAVGAGYPDDLALVYEAYGPRVLTGFASRLAADALRDAHQVIARFEPRTLGDGLHITCHRPLPVQCTSCIRRASAQITAHRADHLLVEVTVHAEDADGPLATITHTIRVPVAVPGPDARVGAPNLQATGEPLVRTVTVSPELLPMYRLLQNLLPDTVPEDVIHIDPERSRRYGLEQPILFGEQTLGMVVRIATAALCPDRPERLSEVSARYSGMVRPGDMVSVTITPMDEGRFAIDAANQDGRPVLRDGLLTVT